MTTPPGCGHRGCRAGLLRELARGRRSTTPALRSGVLRRRISVARRCRGGRWPTPHLGRAIARSQPISTISCCSGVRLGSGGNGRSTFMRSRLCRRADVVTRVGPDLWITGLAPGMSPAPAVLLAASAWRRPVLRPGRRRGRRSGSPRAPRIPRDPVASRDSALPCYAYSGAAARVMRLSVARMSYRTSSAGIAGSRLTIS